MILLGRPHTPWIPERARSFAELSKALDVHAQSDVTEKVFDDREPNWKWSHRMWAWAAPAKGSAFVTLQDDVRILANFWPALRRMLRALPGEIIALENAHPAAPALLEEGHRWLTTSDMLIGVGYAMPSELLYELLSFRASLLGDGVEKVNEDTLVAMFAMATGRRIWSPMPTIIDHDVSLRSTYGNDKHANRRPTVPPCWDAWGNDGWAEPPTRDKVPHLGCSFYGRSIANACRRWVAGFDERRWRAAITDDGHELLEALRFRTMAKRYTPPRHRVMISTPTRGAPHPEYFQSVWRAQKAVDIDFEHDWELQNIRLEDSDLVRVRSRAARIMLDTRATHLLCADDDVSFEPHLLGAMLMLDRDVVCCPYPRRDGHGYSLRVSDAIRARGGFSAEDVNDDGTIEIEGTGLGLTLIKREVIERMVEHYGVEAPDITDPEIDRLIDACRVEEGTSLAFNVRHLARIAYAMGQRNGGSLVFDDVAEGVSSPTVALFQLMFEGRKLLGEDQSFFARWRAMGGKVHLYCGPGTPLNHYTRHAVKGRIEDLGLTHAGPPEDGAMVDTSRDGAP